MGISSKRNHLKIFLSLILVTISLSVYMFHYYGDLGFDYREYVSFRVQRGHTEIFPQDNNNFTVRKGDKVILEIAVKEMQLQHPVVLHFATSNASVTAYEGEKVVYEMATSLQQRGERISEIFPHFSVDSRSENLRLELDVVSDSHSFYVEDFIGYDANNPYTYFYVFNIFIWISSFMLISYILYLIFVVPFLKVDRKRAYMNTVVGVIIFLLFMSTMAKTGYYTYFFKDNIFWIRLNNYIRFLFPAVFFGYFGFIVEDEKVVRLRKAVFAGNILFAIAAIAGSLIWPSCYNGIVDIFKGVIIFEVLFAIFGFRHLLIGKKLNVYEAVMFVGLLSYFVPLIVLSFSRGLRFSFATGITGIFLYVLSGSMFSILFMYSYILRTVHLFMEQERNLKISRQTIYGTQIVPHVIFNTLACINEVIYRDPEEASDLLCDFSKYLRTKIDYDAQQNHLISFAEEMENIRNYIHIMKVSRKFAFSFELKVSEFKVPYLSIQPFVENAIKHGIATRENGEIHVCSEETETHYCLRITDNGIGFAVENTSYGVGIRGSVERLKTLCNGEVKIQSEKEKGTEVTVLIPKNAGGNDYEEHYR